MPRLAFNFAAVAIVLASAQLLLGSLPTFLSPMTAYGQRYVSPSPLISWRTGAPWGPSQLQVSIDSTGRLWGDGLLLDPASVFRSRGPSTAAVDMMLIFLGSCAPIVYGLILVCTILSMLTPYVVRFRSFSPGKVNGFAQWIMDFLFATATWGLAYIAVIGGIRVSLEINAAGAEPQLEFGFYQAAGMVVITVLYALGYALEFEDMMHNRTGQIQLRDGDVESGVGSPVTEEKEAMLVDGL